MYTDDRADKNMALHVGQQGYIHTLELLINPWCACVRVTVLGLCVCVGLGLGSGTTSPATMRN